MFRSVLLTVLAVLIPILFVLLVITVVLIWKTKILNFKVRNIWSDIFGFKSLLKIILRVSLIFFAWKTKYNRHAIADFCKKIKIIFMIIHNAKYFKPPIFKWTSVFFKVLYCVKRYWLHTCFEEIKSNDSLLVKKAAAADIKHLVALSPKKIKDKFCIH